MQLVLSGRHSRHVRPAKSAVVEHLPPGARFFWAWHRMYLHFFERIVRKQSGMYDWAIPYWDWTNPGERAIPAPFRNERACCSTARETRPLMAEPHFRPISRRPSPTHSCLPITSTRNRRSTGVRTGASTSPSAGTWVRFRRRRQMPVFWIHHAQIDRLWNLWLAQGGGRGNPLGDAPWKALKYTFFDECCQPVTMSGCQVIRAANQLSYAYEGEPPQFNQYCLRQAIRHHLETGQSWSRSGGRFSFGEARSAFQFLLLLRKRGTDRSGASIGTAACPPHRRRRSSDEPRRELGGTRRPARLHAQRAQLCWPVRLVQCRPAGSWAALPSGGIRISRSIRREDRIQRECSSSSFRCLVSKADDDPRRIVPKVPVTVGELSIVVDAPAKLPPRMSRRTSGAKRICISLSVAAGAGSYPPLLR